MRQGIVAVRYQGCEMDVLERCSVAAQYRYLGTTRAQDKVVMRDEDELYAKLPMGAAGLEGELQHSGQLTVGMDLVGRYEAQKLSVSVSELQGECTGATHFIYDVSVGAFDFYAGADAAVGASAGWPASAQARGLAGVVTEHHEERRPRRVLQSDARRQGAAAQCGALIRIEVVPLGAATVRRRGARNGTQWDGTQCVGTKIATNVQCPAGDFVERVPVHRQRASSGCGAAASGCPARGAASCWRRVDRGAAAASLGAIASALGACRRPTARRGRGT